MKTDGPALKHVLKRSIKSTHHSIDINNGKTLLWNFYLHIISNYHAPV